MRGGRLLYFSDFSCSFVVVFLFPIPFVFFVLYCIASFLSLLFSCIVLSVFLSIVYCIVLCIVLYHVDNNIISVHANIIILS